MVHGRAYRERTVAAIEKAARTAFAAGERAGRSLGRYERTILAGKEWSDEVPAATASNACARWLDLGGEWWREARRQYACGHLVKSSLTLIARTASEAFIDGHLAGQIAFDAEGEQRSLFEG